MFSLQFPTAPVALRIVCGFFFVPHAIGKFTVRDTAFSFFQAAGFRPAPLFVYTAMAIELVVATLLITGFLVRASACLASIYLFIGAAAVIKVEKKWLWHLGGCEYAIFWGICCAIVAASA
jgi:putative oxidoreductase